MRSLGDLQRPTLGKVEDGFPIAVRRDGEPDPALLKYASALGENGLDIDDVLEHVDQEDSIEVAGAERERLSCGDHTSNVGTYGAYLEHLETEITGDREWRAELFEAVTAPTADFQDTASASEKPPHQAEIDLLAG